jgi:hypothetical protein
MNEGGGLAVIRLDQIVVTHGPCDSGISTQTGDISEILRIFLMCMFFVADIGLSACNRIAAPRAP